MKCTSENLEYVFITFYFVDDAVRFVLFIIHDLVISIHSVVVDFRFVRYVLLFVHDLEKRRKIKKL